MKIAKVILLVFFLIFAALQFFRPSKNSGSTDPSTDVSAAVPMPPGVAALLKESCYDCHSNETRYPWYAEVMPAGWFLAGHIDNAKSHLNFSEFTTVSLRRQFHKFEEITEQIDLGEMPLPSYLILHGAAELSPEKKQLLLTWAEDSRESMKARYPIDSLVRRRN